MITGIHSIGIAVQTGQLEQIAAYYTQRGDFATLGHSSGTDHEGLAALFGVPCLSYASMWLDVKTTLLELTQFAFDEAFAPPGEMPVIGPGLTHVCYQSPASQPAYERFKGGETRLISRGDRPIDLARAGITYAYARDPAGNIFEMEQLTMPLRPEALWMGHIALVTYDIERLTRFYSQTLLGQDNAPACYRFGDNPRLDDVADVENVSLIGAWIRAFPLQLEFWQYLNPPTPVPPPGQPVPRQGYYTINFEVDDVHADYERLQAQGVRFAASPRIYPNVTQVYGFDPDGNAFQLRQSFTSSSQMETGGPHA